MMIRNVPLRMNGPATFVVAQRLVRAGAQGRSRDGIDAEWDA